MKRLPKPYWQSTDGGAVLYCGDCMEILPLLDAGSVDAVVEDTTKEICHEQSAGGKRTKKKTSSSGMAEATSGNRMALQHPAMAATEGSRILQGDIGSDSESDEAARHQNENASECRKEKRKIQGREIISPLSDVDNEGQVSEVRDDGRPRHSSQKRRPSRQPARESGSPLQLMPHERYEAQMVGSEEGRIADAKKQRAGWMGTIAIVTDSPYGINLQDNSCGGRHGRKRTAWEYGIVGDQDQSAGLFVLNWCEKNKLPTIAFSSPKLPWPGGWTSYLVWDKGGAVGGGGDVRRSWKQTWELIQAARCGVLRGYRDSAVLRFFVTPDLSARHPAEKPLDLMVYLVEKLNADTILDPFAGSGTTGVAAIRTGRKCILIEKEEKYCAIAAKRLAEACCEGPGQFKFPEPDLFGDD